MQWYGLLEHLWSVGCHGRVFHPFKSYLSDRYIRGVTPLDSSDLHPVSAGVDDHTLLTTISHKDNRATAATHLNADLAALCEYGHHWNIEFAALKTFSLVVSLESNPSNHPPLFLNDVHEGNIWVSCIVVNLYLEVRALLPFTNLGSTLWFCPILRSSTDSPESSRSFSSSC